MAQYLGSISGQRGAVTRLGSKASGLRVVGNAWNVGAVVYLNHMSARDSDIVSITIDGGSHAERDPIHLITLDERDTPLEIAAKLREAADRIESGQHRLYGWPDRRANVWQVTP